MRVLAIDTALKACSVAVWAPDRSPVAASEPMERGHAERLAPMAAEVVEASGLAFADFDRIAVTTGPGSFTGVRVGLSFARALALALDRPCIGLSTLAAMALEAGDGGVRAAAIRTPGGAYIAAFADGNCIHAPSLVAEADFGLLAFGAGAIWRGPGADLFGGDPTPSPDILALARRTADLDPARHLPQPLYLRAPDAKLPA